MYVIYYIYYLYLYCMFYIYDFLTVVLYDLSAKCWQLFPIIYDPHGKHYQQTI